jgi:hypothetical protein
MKIQNSRGETMTMDELANMPVPEADGPPVTPAEDEAMETLATAPMVARPSLEVETEVNENLMPRVLSHVGRMRAWDLRSLTPDMRLSFTGAVEDLAAAFARLQDELGKLAAFGFVAKTTPVTRLRAVLTAGTKVNLRADKRAEFSEVYPAEVLDNLTVGAVGATHALVVSGERELGPVKLIHLEVKE